MCIRDSSDNLCGAAFVQSYSCDDDYAAIQLRSGHSLGHTFCTCTSGDSSATGGPIYVRESKTWSEARAFCQGLGRDLVSIHSAAENSIVYTLIQDNWDHHSSQGTWPGTWIGFSDAAHEGTWTWSDGTPTDYVNFQAGEPNQGANENCGFFY